MIFKLLLPSQYSSVLTTSHGAPSGAHADVAKAAFYPQFHASLAQSQLTSPRGALACRMGSMIVLHYRAANRTKGVHEVFVTEYDCKRSANTWSFDYPHFSIW